MNNDNELLLEQKYAELCEKLSAHRLPRWKELPDIELYMDQVVAVMEKALGLYCETDADDSRIITPSIINNYVKLKVIPAPTKKRYSKEHLAYLIIICILKQTLSISSIVKIIERQLKSKSIEQLYDNFCSIYREVISFANIKEPSFEINLLEESENSEDMNSFILKSAILSTTGKIMCEGILSVITSDKEKEKDKEKDKKDKDKA